MRYFHLLAAALVLSSACGGVNAPAEGDATGDEQNLAPAIELVEPGLYRGHRPDTATLQQLKSLGVKTILDLEDTQSAIKPESATARSLGMTFISEPMSGFWAPNDAEVDQIEAIMADKSRRPLFVHCQHGEDRTGLIVGLYRVQTEHWTPAAAYREMLAKGFHKILVFLNHYYEEKTGFED
jgi:tyrosine-protein phosphatase SIW14